MKYLKPIYLSLFLVLALLSCNNSDDDGNNENQDNLEIYQELDVSYGTHAHQKYDIYLPANRTEDTNLVILVHGGGWSAGDKSDMNPFVSLIQQNFPNLGVVNINYRLADDTNHAFPMQLNDITAIINQLNVDRSTHTFSDEFGFIGVSAGAHLGMLWSYAYDDNAKSKMVCSIVGPTNFTDPAYTSASFSPILQQYLVNFPNQTTAFLETVSPYHQVTSAAAPTILFYGGQDPLIPTSQGVSMDAKLTQLGVTHEFTLYPDEGHGWIGTGGLTALDTWVKLQVFMNTHLVN
jgi:acetyl esterase/lipase